MKSQIGIRGFYRVQIEEDGEVVGDSGLLENQITNVGLELYLAKLLAGSAGSKQIGAVGLGTGGAPASNATTLPGEIMSSTKRNTALTLGFSARTTSDGSCTMQFTATFASSDSFLTAAANLSNVGLYALTTSNDTLFAGNTFASSSCNTNQNVNITYQIRLG